MHSTNSARRLSISSPAFSKRSRRSLGPTADQVGKAFWAAAAAAFASATLAAAARVTTSEEIGLRRSVVAPPDASTAWPPTNSLEYLTDPLLLAQAFAASRELRAFPGVVVLARIRPINGTRAAISLIGTIAAT